MIGAISGDVIGSVHEGAPAKAKGFPLFVADSTFTDDTGAYRCCRQRYSRGRGLRIRFDDGERRYPHAGYGGWFRDWLFREDAAPYNSFGNGSAMRVAAIGWAFEDLNVVLREAAKSAEVTHNHPEGIKGAQAVAAAILVARPAMGRTRLPPCYPTASATIAPWS